MNHHTEIAPGDKVRHANRLWEVIKIEGSGDNAKVTLFNKKDGTKVGYRNDLALELVRTPIDLIKSHHFCSSKAFDVYTQAAKYSLAYEYDRFLSISSSRTRLEPFQLEAVLKALTSLRARLLLADDVGLGKSVEAGLIFKELEARGRADRVLLVVPASLISQWQREMHEKFGVIFREANRNLVADLSKYALDDKTPWDMYPLLITSIDFMKQFTQNEQKIKNYELFLSKVDEKLKKTGKKKLDRDELFEIVKANSSLVENLSHKFIERFQKGKIPKHFHSLGNAKWDLIIIDEAHYCDKTTGSRGEAKGNARSRLADVLAERCDSLLLLTATPHNGDPMSLYSLVELLDPYLFKDLEDMRANPDRIAQVMIRRGKKGLIDVDGKKIFKEREVQTLEVNGWSVAERGFYERISHYLQGGFLSADSESGQKRRNLNFAMVILQKRTASGIAAIKISLERRIEKLKKRSFVLSTLENSEIEDYSKHEIDLTDEEKEKIEGKLEGIPIRESVEDIEQEIADLQKLHQMVSQIPTDAKWGTLRLYLRHLFEKSPEEKVIIFTEYRDTLNDLKDKLKKDMPWLPKHEAKKAKSPEIMKNFSDLRTAFKKIEEHAPQSKSPASFEESVAVIHGNMRQEERIKAEEQFMKDSCRILLATDSASEGLNLQKRCHILINYELPWNPNRLEQRIGRVHRYGQKKDVEVFNLLNLDTKEDQILKRLQKKIDEISKAIGSTGEVLGIVAKANIEEAIRKSLKDDIPAEVTALEIEAAIEQNRQICEEYRRLGLTRLQEFDSTKMQKILGIVAKNKELEDGWKNGKFFKQLMSIFFKEGSVTPKKSGDEFRVKLPAELYSVFPKESLESVVFDKDHPLLQNGYHTEYIALGHPIVRAMLRKVLAENQEGTGQATYKILKEANETGLLINYRYRTESESARFDPDSGEPESRMEVLAEEIVPVFVSQNHCSVELGTLFSGCEGIKESFPNEQVATLYENMDEWLARAEQLVRDKIAETKRRLETERKERVALRLQDVERYWQGISELRRQRLKKYEKEKAQGVERTALINLEKFELEKLEQHINQQRKILQAMENVYDYAPEILNAAWIIPETLIRRKQDATN
jgi:SNF2 family DNA or RNA helicase